MFNAADHEKTIRTALERGLQLERALDFHAGKYIRKPNGAIDWDTCICGRCAPFAEALASLSALQEERERMRRLLTNIELNAVVVPDPAMKGLTDTYSVPLDDIEAARAAMEPAPQDQFSRPLWNSTVESLVASDTPEADRELQLRGYRPAPQEGRS